MSAHLEKTLLSFGEDDVAEDDVSGDGLSNAPKKTVRKQAKGKADYSEYHRNYYRNHKDNITAEQRTKQNQKNAAATKRYRERHPERIRIIASDQT